MVPLDLRRRTSHWQGIRSWHASRPAA